MIEIELAQVYGFCPGVRRAVEMVEEHLRERGPLATLGAIVHNARVVDRLAARGAQGVGSLDEVRAPAVAITAHGAGPEVVEEIRRRGLALVDTTCPIVKRAQEAAHRLTAAGFAVLIYGEATHPEVEGLLAWTGGRGHATLVPADVPPAGDGRLAIVSQTTKEREAFWEFVGAVVAWSRGALRELQVVDTTCPETGRRYRAAQDLAQRVEAIFVVGSRNSANTRRLAEVVRATGVRTHFIESEDEIEREWLSGLSRVGVTAGASTPDEAVQAVISRLENVGGNR
ncbi:MAG: 4-hydroxy-3-methylbut-2-enyl diphosphate reductase [Candidatus Bipolaricaulis sibiricus]|uniref:4-hydroxy-3-methylbut-2-enyl diphosphate reductase n=1 Tax=Bipolaricaulis sibiricus TaxID=2501609 RepID=A0A410FVR5_BIPS1|nr:MAG: 4-hydroxy-3-methylbut-2-enyl diphosphate reductase [Candidatus Bipolaricaulis sibiricus]